MVRSHILTVSVLLLSVIYVVEGCRKTCDGEEGIGKNLRPHFSSCLKDKIGDNLNWEYLVNYVVWDDIWYLATDTFFCRGKDYTCWMTQIEYLLKPMSKYVQPLKECITDYAVKDATNTTILENECEATEDPVYVPTIIHSFTTIKDCPLSDFKYKSCLTSSTLGLTRSASVKPGTRVVLPRYNFIQLPNFIMNHRSDCRITAILGSRSFITSCPTFSSKPSPLSNQSGPSGLVIRTKRALTLADLIAASEGGRLNFRISSSGKATILPSKPLKRKIVTIFECFGLKLQAVLRPKSVLYSATSRCNVDAAKKPVFRVSTAFRWRAKPKKLPGMVGTCEPNDVWTAWYDIDDPDKSGDQEYFSWIRNRYADVCFRPTAVQAFLVRNNQTYTSAGQTIRVDPSIGLSCYNYKQKGKKCEDYKVRFCCPKL